MKSNNFLKVIFIVLFVVLLGELGYIFLIPANSKIKNQAITPPVQPSGAQEGQNANTIKTKAIDPFYIDTLINAERDSNKRYLLTIEETGYISDLTTDKLTVNGTEYLASLTISDANQNVLEQFYFNQKRLDQFKFYKQIGEEKQAITLNDLTKGDKIKFVSVIDLLEKDNSKDIIANELVILK